jgi:integrase
MKISLHDVHNYIDRHGKARSYFGRGKGAVALTARPIGGREWQKQYEAARDGQPFAVSVGAERSKQGSIASVIASFMLSHEYRGFDEKTKGTYRGPFKFLKAEMGTASVAHLRRRQIVELLEDTETAGAHNALLGAFRKIIETAIKLELRDDDPTSQVKKMARENVDGVATWALAHIEAYRRRHPVGTVARFALEAAYATGLRVSDLYLLSRAHISADGKELKITPFKTRKWGTLVKQPIRDAAFIAALAAAPQRDLRPFIHTKTGKDFSSAGELSKQFAIWCKEAELPDEIRAHGLRKACAVRLAHAGLSDREIMAWIGDRDPKMVALYTKERDTALLSESGADKLEAYAARA